MQPYTILYVQEASENKFPTKHKKKQNKTHQLVIHYCKCNQKITTENKNYRNSSIRDNAE